MRDVAAAPIVAAMTQQPAFMVEAFKPAAGPGSHPHVPGRAPTLAVDGVTVLALIDIPSDETALVLVAATNAEGAADLVRRGGLRPIRVVDVRLDDAFGTTVPVSAFEPGGTA
jgi:hypothetical protein